MTIITIASSKGGVGKTTTAVNLAAALGQIDPTLLVDLDSQGQCSLFLGLPPRGSVYDWLVDDQPLAVCLMPHGGVQLQVLAGNFYTRGAERIFGGEGRFDELVARLRALPFRYVVVDTAPGGVLQEAALAAANQVIIPFRPETAGVDGVFTALELVGQLAAAADVTLLPVAFDRRVREHTLNVAYLREKLGEDYGLAVEDAVPNRIAVAELVGLGKTVWEHQVDALVEVRAAYLNLLNRVVALAAAEVNHAD